MKVIQLSICCLLAAFFIVSCQKEELNVDQVAPLESEDTYASATLRGDSTDISLEERCMKGDTIENLRRLPNVIFRYINANYDSAPSIAVVKNQKTIAVQLEDGTILLFSLEGRFVKECDDLDPDITLEERCMMGDTVQNLRRLPTVIFRYINANYDSRPVTAVVKNKKTISVQLEDGTILIFSIKGRFIKECGQPNPDTALEERCMKGDTIQNLERLPVAVVRYVNANYDADIDVAVVRPRKTITVQLTDGTILIFNIKGRYIKECGEGIPPRDSIKMPWRDSLKIDRSNLPPRIKRDR